MDEKRDDFERKRKKVVFKNNRVEKGLEDFSFENQVMGNEDWKWGEGRGGFRLTRILSRESYREMFSQKMFRIKENITLDKLFFCSDEEDSFF